MEHIDIRPNLDQAPWTDLADGALTGDVAGGKITRVGLLPRGTVSGAPTVGVVIELDDGRRVVGETTWALFEGAARALAASPVHQAGA